MHYLMLIATCSFLADSVCAGTSPAYRMQRAILVERDLSTIERLLADGFNPTDPIGCGTFDSLDGAVSVASVEIVELFLKHGARPKPSTFVNAAFIASHNIATEIITAFLKAGSDVNFKDCYSTTAIHNAVYRENTELVFLLLNEKGISLDDLNIDGNTALMTAVARNNKPLVQMLLKAGADPLVRNESEASASTVSQNIIKNQQELLRLLSVGTKKPHS